MVDREERTVSQAAKLIFSNVAAAVGSSRMLATSQVVVPCLPVPSIAVRYLFQRVGIPLGKVLLLAGETASYKSTMAAEIIRWNLLAGGIGYINEAESKPADQLRRGILQEYADDVGTADCDSMESWQQNTTFVTREYQKLYKSDPPPPLCLVTDSVAGKLSRKTMNKVLTEGYGSPGYSMEALGIRQWVMAYSSLLIDWPITFVGVAHLKIRTLEAGHTSKDVSGGLSLGFMSMIRLEMSVIKQLERRAEYNRVMVSMQLGKNSYGEGGRRIHVPITFRMVPKIDPQTGEIEVNEETGVPAEQLLVRFEWWEAAVDLLSEGVGMKETDKKYFLPKIAEVVDIHSKSGGARGWLYWSKRLDVPSSEPISAHDFGVLLEQNSQVLDDLYRVFGIEQSQLFTPGTDFRQLATAQLRQAAAADNAKVSDAVANFKSRRKKKELDVQTES